MNHGMILNHIKELKENCQYWLEICENLEYQITNDARSPSIDLESRRMISNDISGLVADMTENRHNKAIFEDLLDQVIEQKYKNFYTCTNCGIIVKSIVDHIPHTQENTYDTNCDYCNTRQTLVFTKSRVI